MAKKRRKLTYEEPVTKLERRGLGGVTGRRLRGRISKATRLAYEAESQAFVEQAIGYLAESRGLSIEEAREALIREAAAQGLTMREAAQRVLPRKD